MWPKHPGSETAVVLTGETEAQRGHLCPEQQIQASDLVTTAVEARVPRSLSNRQGWVLSFFLLLWVAAGRQGWLCELDTEPQPQCPHARSPGLQDLEDMTLEDEASWTQAHAIRCQGNTSVPRPL